MENLALKIKISVLWLFMVLAMMIDGMLSLAEPGAIEEIMTGVVEGIEIGPEILLLLAIILWVPLVMAFLSLTLKDSSNRWANIILGIVFTGLNFFSLIDGLVTRPSAHVLLILGSTVVAAALIVWYAWKWPKEVSH